MIISEKLLSASQKTFFNVGIIKAKGYFKLVCGQILYRVYATSNIPYNARIVMQTDELINYEQDKIRPSK